ncbi:VanW family protein [Nocardioides sp.]|uniref:VanW family protein n=1 Tax=Nocardioides sp. TaxID=35761 RepID=UPI003516B974
MSKPARERSGGLAVVAVVLVLALLAGGGYAAAYAAAADKLPRGTTVADVEVGGRTPAQARGRVAAELGPVLERSVPVVTDNSGSTASDAAGEIVPAEAGISFDYDATLAAAAADAERSWSPGHLWDHFTGGEDLDPVVTVDEEQLGAALEGLGADLGTPAVDGAVSFRDGRVVVTDAVVGRGIDPEGAADAIVAAALAGDTATLTLTDLEPDIDQAEVDAAVTGFANPALASPVTLRFGSARITLEPRDYADALRLTPVDGALVPGVKEARLLALVEAASAGDGAPVDATIELRDGRPRVVPAKPGLTYETEDVVDTFLALLAAPEGERFGVVDGTATQPEFTTREARELGVKEKISEFTTYFPYAEYRNVNIGRAAEIVDGTLLMPGDVFSLNKIVGERTRENGFTEGFIISNGIFATDLGGGVSQMATTTFNAAFFAGLEDVEHKPHSFYIDRYPVGREATVAWPTVDLRFRNDSGHGVLIDTELRPSTPSSQGVLTVRMYGTKVWDVESVTSDRYAYVAPARRVLDTPDCYPNAGYSGFQVDVTRIFRRPGDDEIVRREVFHTDYIASDTVICRPPGSLDEG